MDITVEKRDMSIVRAITVNVVARDYDVGTVYTDWLGALLRTKYDKVTTVHLVCSGDTWPVDAPDDTAISAKVSVDYSIFGGIEHRIYVRSPTLRKHGARDVASFTALEIVAEIAEELGSMYVATPND